MPGQPKKNIQNEEVIRPIALNGIPTNKINKSVERNGLAMNIKSEDSLNAKMNNGKNAKDINGKNIIKKTENGKQINSQNYIQKAQNYQKLENRIKSKQQSNPKNITVHT